MMLRQERRAEEEDGHASRRRGAGGRGTGGPGSWGSTTGLALWVFAAIEGVVAPLADAVARFDSPAQVVQAQVCTRPTTARSQRVDQPCCAATVTGAARVVAAARLIRAPPGSFAYDPGDARAFVLARRAISAAPRAGPGAKISSRREVAQDERKRR